MNNKTKYATVNEMSKLYPSFSEPSLRFLIYKSKENGLSSCIRRIGRKILINTKEFEAWIDSKKEKK